MAITAITSQLISRWPETLAEIRAGAEEGLRLSGDKMKFEIIGELYGTKSGRTYSRDGRSHQASAPGETPASDYKKLEGSLRAELESESVMSVSASTPYALALEFGSIQMLPRPLFLPVAMELGGNDGQVIQIIGKAINSRLR